MVGRWLDSGWTWLDGGWTWLDGVWTLRLPVRVGTVALSPRHGKPGDKRRVGGRRWWVRVGIAEGPHGSGPESGDTMWSSSGGLDYPRRFMGLQMEVSRTQHARPPCIHREDVSQPQPLVGQSPTPVDAPRLHGNSS